MTHVTSTRATIIYIFLDGEREYRPHPRTFRCERNVVEECSVIPTQSCGIAQYDLTLRPPLTVFPHLSRLSAHRSCAQEQLRIDATTPLAVELLLYRRLVWSSRVTVTNGTLVDLREPLPRNRAVARRRRAVVVESSSSRHRVAARRGCW